VTFVDRLDALRDRELRRTLLFVRGRPRPSTAAEVSAALGVPRSVARWRLEKLVAAGLLQAEFERRTGRSGPGAGRPAKTYAPRPETLPIEFPRRRYEALIGLLAGALPGPERAQQLEAVGNAYALELAAAMRVRPAKTLRTAAARVCRGLGRLGFHAAVEAATATKATFVCATCPLRPVVVSDPEAAAIDAGMWRGLVGAALAGDVAVECSTHDCLDLDKSCRIRVTVAA